LTNFAPAATHNPDVSVSRATKAFAGVLVAAALLLAAALVDAGSTLEGSPVVLGILCVIALVAERQSVAISPSAQVSVSVLPLLFAAVVFGPLSAMVVGAFAMLADFGPPFTRWITWTASRSLVGGPPESRRWCSFQRARHSCDCCWAWVLWRWSRRQLTYALQR
jgi:hypothetical protein